MSSSLNLATAFDTVSHMHIDSALQRFGVSPDFVELVWDLYGDADHFKLEKGKTSEIPMTRGVKQGDLLSPLLFNIAYFDSTELSKDPKATGLRKALLQYKFVAITWMLMDIIPVVTELNLIFQKDSLDIAVIKPVVDNTIAKLD